MKRPTKGFTVLELTTAIAIILILVAVAFASYRDFESRKSRRLVSAALTDVAGWLTSQHANMGSYQLMRLPYSQIPSPGPVRYQLSLPQVDTHASDPNSVFPPVTINTFTLRAEPINADTCGGRIAQESISAT